MRVLKFDYTDDGKLAFALLFSAWHYIDPQQRLPLVSVGTTAERIELAVEINKMFREASFQLSPVRFELRGEGYEMQLRETGLNLIREFWDLYKQRLPPVEAEGMMVVDRFLKDAPTLNGKASET